ERCSLFRFDWRPIKFRSDKHGAEKTVAVQKFEMQFAPAFHVQRGNPEFLPGFSNNPDLRRFSLFEPPADPVDFSGAQTAFLPNHQNAPFLPDEAERCQLSRLPTGPIDSHDRLLPRCPRVCRDRWFFRRNGWPERTVDQPCTSGVRKIGPSPLKEDLHLIPKPDKKKQVHEEPAQPCQNAPESNELQICNCLI